MTLRAIWGAVLLLSACTPDPARQPEANAVVGTKVTSPSVPPPAARVPAGGTLKAQVSGLSGDISSLRVRVTDLETIVDLPSDVLFAFDSAELTPAAAAPLTRTAELVGQGAAGDIRVVGHTDAVGDDGYNLQLSLRRAQAVAAWLGGHGVDPARLKPEGRGEAEPVAPSARAGGADDPAGRALNRRVAVAIPR